MQIYFDTFSQILQRRENVSKINKTLLETKYEILKFRNDKELLYEQIESNILSGNLGFGAISLFNMHLYTKLLKNLKLYYHLNENLLITLIDRIRSVVKLKNLYGDEFYIDYGYLRSGECVVIYGKENLGKYFDELVDYYVKTRFIKGYRIDFLVNDEVM
jgi:hypothetical protein